MIIALASPRVAESFVDGLVQIETLLDQASRQKAEIVCFPEAYLPGLRGQDFEVLPWEKTQEVQAIEAVSALASRYKIAVIISVEHITETGRQIAAAVIGPRGNLRGFQTKNQLDPSEERFYVPGSTRKLFELNGLKFGITICHEGWRYPETVRWAAVRGAKIVFHPQHTGSHHTGAKLTTWGATENPYYEQAMMMRSRENTIYFASVNYALPFQDAATSLIAPSGECQAYLPYGQEGVLVQNIDPAEATGLLGARYAPDRYREES